MYKRETRLANHIQILQNSPESGQSANSITSITKNTLPAVSAKSQSMSTWATILSSKHTQVLQPFDQHQALPLLKALLWPQQTHTEINPRCSEQPTVY